MIRFWGDFLAWNRNMFSLASVFQCYISMNDVLT